MNVPAKFNMLFHRPIIIKCRQNCVLYRSAHAAESFTHKLTSRGILSSEELSTRLLEETGVALLPGSDFYMPKDFFGVRVASVDFNGTQLMQDFPESGELTPDLYRSLFPGLTEASERIGKWLH